MTKITTRSKVYRTAQGAFFAAGDAVTRAEVSIAIGGHTEQNVQALAKARENAAQALADFRKIQAQAA
jgi:hypothetical protein